MKRFLRRDGVVAGVLWVLVLSGYLLSGNTATYDSALSLHTALSLVREGNTDLDEYGDIVRTTWLSTEEIDGHIYMLYPVGASLLAAPIVWVIDRVSPEFAPSLRSGFGEPVQTVIASVITALTVVVIYFTARLYVTQPYALLTALTLAFGTAAWSVTSRTLWSHGPSMLMLSLALYLILRARTRPPLIQFVSLPLAFAYVIRPTNSVAVVVFSLYVLIAYRRYFIRYLAWALLIGVPFLWLNLSVYHAVLPNYYRWYSGFSLETFFQALVGHVLSPSRGLLIYSPILILSIAGVIIKAKRREFERHDPYVLAIMGLHWAAISLWWNWWGGVSYGPRLFSDMLPYFAYWLIPVAAAMAQAARVKKRALAATWAALLGISVLIHGRGVASAEVMEWNASPAPIDFYSFRVWDWRDPQWLRGISFDSPVDLAVSGLPHDQVIDPAVEARLGSRSIQGRQFEVTSALIAPPGEAWYAIAENQKPAAEFAAWFEQAQPLGEGHTIAEYPPYRLYRFNLADRVQQAAEQADHHAAGVELPLKFDDTAELMAYHITPSADGLTLITYWRAGQHIIAPLKLFVHAVAADGSIVAQDDRLDAPAELWHTDDWIVQINRVQLPVDAPPVTVVLGLYNPDTNTRLPIIVNDQPVDRLVLGSLDLK